MRDLFTGTINENREGLVYNDKANRKTPMERGDKKE